MNRVVARLILIALVCVHPAIVRASDHAPVTAPAAATPVVVRPRARFAETVVFQSTGRLSSLHSTFLSYFITLVSMPFATIGNSSDI